MSEEIKNEVMENAVEAVAEKAEVNGNGVGYAILAVFGLGMMGVGYAVRPLVTKVRERISDRRSKKAAKTPVEFRAEDQNQN